MIMLKTVTRPRVKTTPAGKAVWEHYQDMLERYNNGQVSSTDLAFCLGEAYAMFRMEQIGRELIPEGEDFILAILDQVRR